ncbi:hypothetical protein [Shinella zoogloeoides]|uniref:hypothetical protein n=1 Tax=Shinella zoogloeoides TaxID=352475 RepID=UPI0028A742A7|nr:hypothetical protein [Shinella zoogloeoides]
MADLSSLIARLEKAEGPSRELDTEIAIALGVIPGRDWWSMDYIKSGILGRYTSSIDAAVSLANRVLPGWFWRCGSTPLFPNGWAHVSRYHADHCDRQDEASCADGKAANVAIALVLATLRALQQKGSSNE